VFVCRLFHRRSRSKVAKANSLACASESYAIRVSTNHDGVGHLLAYSAKTTVTSTAATKRREKGIQFNNVNLI